MKVKHLYITLTLLVFTAFSINAQDIHLTQTNMTPLLVNPANAGAEYEIRGILNYRSQWTSSDAPFKTMMASYDMNFKKGKKSKTGFFGGGLYLFNDKAGTANITTNQANLSVAYHLNLNQKNTLGIGVQGGYFQRSTSTSDLKWGSQFDGYSYNADYSSGETAGDKFTVGSTDYNTGLVWTYRNDERYFSGEKVIITTGLSFHHINKPSYENQGLVTDNLYNRWIGHSSATIGLNTKFSILPYVFYSYQGEIDEAMFGSNMLYALKNSSTYTNNVKGMAIGGGAFYRWNDAVILTVLAQYSNYMFEFSYDINTSSYNNATGGNGAFELSIQYVYPSPFGGVKSRSRFN
jgi:type IX secretion system PorP/SprF family membrane protein